MGRFRNLVIMIIGTIFLSIGIYDKETSAIIVGSILWGYIIIKGIWLKYMD